MKVERTPVEWLDAYAASLLGAMGDLVVVTDPRFRILYVNPAVEACYGYSASELIGQTPDILSGQEDTGEILESIERRLASGRAWYGDLIQRHKNGSLFRCTFRVFAFEVPPGEPLLASVGRCESRLDGTVADDLGTVARARNLTERELQVLELLVLGKTGKQIAARLRVTERTVRFHIRNVLRKLGARSRADLLRVLWRL